MEHAHPSSSKAMEILMPLGVWVVYNVMSDLGAAIVVLEI